MNNGNVQPLSAVSAVFSVVGAVLLFTALTGTWNPLGMNGMFTGGAIALVGALTGFIASRTRPDGLNRLGLWLGLIVIALTVLLVVWFSPVEVEAPGPI